MMTEGPQGRPPGTERHDLSFEPIGIALQFIGHTREDAMPTGLSLHLGLNAVDPGHYEGWSGQLTACEADAKDMAAIAALGGFKPTTILTKKATRAALNKYLSKAAATLKPGDSLLVSYSGHGGQVPDKNGDEDDSMDETWCLYDGEHLDDELFAALGRFREGVRISVFSDSCHSGSVIKNHLVARSSMAAARERRYRAMPKDVVQSVYLKHQKFYDKLQAKTKVDPGAMLASAILISGCQDNQLSQDGTFNGLFTGTLKSVWNGGAWKKGGYKELQKAILKHMPPDQSPNYFLAGKKNAAFEKARPFTVDDKA
jgi:metacaspase-1